VAARGFTRRKRADPRMPWCSYESGVLHARHTLDTRRHTPASQLGRGGDAVPARPQLGRGGDAVPARPQLGRGLLPEHGAHRRAEPDVLRADANAQRSDVGWLPREINCTAGR
jgi:hypothetical protein